MPVKVRCSGCEKVLNVPDAARGRTVKCPQCETRISVPAESAQKAEGAQKSPAPKKPVQERAAKPAASSDSGAFLASMDLRRMEDRDALVCPKCGVDVDEEDTECEACGWDLKSGGLGETAKKKLLKGPDPDKFFEGLWKDGWRFVGRNQVMAWRSIGYSMIASLLTLLTGFLYLYISPWPPRAFFMLIAVVSALVIPGWYLFLNSYIVNLALEKKDKIKKLNFDFFLASSMGLQFIAWHVVFVGPLLLLPVGLVYMITGTGEGPGLITILTGIACYLPIITMAPIVLSHLAMPVSYPGWLFWKVIPAWLRLFKAIALWSLLLLTTLLPSLACWSVIGIVSGSTLVTTVSDMEFNANQARIAADFDANKGKKPKKGAAPPAGGPPKEFKQEIRKINYLGLILPTVLWFVSLFPLGFALLFNCRTNGQFAYYNREIMGLIGQTKEYKYVARLPRKEEEAEQADKPRTATQDFVDAIVVVVMCGMLGGIGGMLYGTFDDTVGMGAGILGGSFYGMSLANFVGAIMMISAAFEVSVPWGLLVIFVPFANLVFLIQHWADARKAFFVSVTAIGLSILMVILSATGLLVFINLNAADPEAAGNVPAAVAPAADPGAPVAP